MPKIKNKYSDFNFEFLKLTQDQFSILKMLKHKRALKKEFDTAKVFSNVRLNYIEKKVHENQLPFLKEFFKGAFYSESFYLRTDYFLNTIIIHSLISHLKINYGNDPYFKDEYKPHKVLSRLMCNSNYLGFTNIYSTAFNQSEIDNYNNDNFVDVYNIMAGNHQKKLSAFYRTLSNYMISSKKYAKAITETYYNILKELNNLMISINWDLSKNYIHQDLFTGLFFRKADCFNIYEKLQDHKRFILNVFNSNKQFILDFVFEKNWWVHKSYFNTNNYSDHNIIEIQTSSELLQKLNYNTFNLISNGDYTYFNFDLIAKKKYPISELKSNNNQTRDWNSKEYNLLPKGLINYEKNINNHLLLGFELEVLKRENCPRDIIKRIEENYLEGTAIVKHDGSIGTKGFEIVTVPMSYDYVKKTNYFINLYNHIKDYLYSYRSSATGLHIHASRDHYTNLEILMIVRLLNETCNAEYISKIAGRDVENTYYAKSWGFDFNFNPNNPVTNKHIKNDVKYYLKKIKDFDDFERYSLLNLNNSKTIEFRLFKGNIYPNAIQRYLEFIKCLTGFVKTINFNQCNLKNFFNYLDKNKDDFRILYNFTFNNPEFEFDFVVNDTNVNRFDVRVKPLDQIPSVTKSEQLAKDLNMIEEHNTNHFKNFKNINLNIPKVKMQKQIRFSKPRRTYQHRTVRITNNG